MSCCAISVLQSNQVSPTGVVGGVDKVLTDELQVTMGAGDTCAISYALRLASIGKDTKDPPRTS